MSLRKRIRLLAIVVLALPVLLTGCGKTLKIAPHADLKVVDPIWTTAYITRNHGYLVYDTLFALDENLEAQPQMLDSWKVSDDQRTWTFVLRDGLKWHDKTPVTAADCVASLERWGKRDSDGQVLFRNISKLSAVDDKTIVMSLNSPDSTIPTVLAKMSSNVPFMMPKRIAESDAFTPIQDTTGSGPYIFKKDEWVPGSKVVYVKNEDYLPRTDDASLAAGAKVAQADRIVWQYYPKQADAIKALEAGEVDYVESVSTRLLSSLEGKKNIVIASTDPLGNLAMMRFNTLIPPFDNAAVRKAVIMAIKQDDYMDAALGDHGEKYWRTCYSVFPCGTPYSTEDGADLMKKGDIAAAKEALQKAGYDGTPVVILNPVDVPVLKAFASVTAGKLKEMGMNVQMQDMDWATLTERRASRASVADGGWNLFHTWWLAADVMEPTAIAFSGNRETGWYGWPADAELEKLRAAFRATSDSNEKAAIAGKVQARLMDIGAIGVLGQFFEPVAYRSDVTGITAPIQFYWSMGLEEWKDK